jgi:hypothetical protein
MDTENIIPQQNPQEDVLDVLAEFESGLEALKALYSQRQRLQSRIRQHEEEVGKKESALAQRSQEIERATAEHHQRQKDLDAALAQINARESELDAAAKALASERASLDVSRSKLDEETHARADALEAQSRKVAEESQAVEKLTHELEGQAKELAEAKAAFEKERRTRAADLKEVEALRADLANQRQSLAAQEQASRELQAKVDALGKDLAQAREQAALHAESARQAAAVTTRSSQDTAALKQQLGEQLALAAKATAESASLKAQVSDLAQQLADQAAAATNANEHSKTSSAHLAALQKKAGEFEQQLAHEKQETARLTAALAQQQQDAAALAKQLDSLNAKLKMELGEREEMRLKLEQAQAGLMQATARSAQLEDALAKAAEQIKSLQKAAANAKPTVPLTASTASMLRRRKRLKLAHDLIRGRYQKLGMAHDALKKRIEQCDQVMAQRQELAAIRDRVVLAERASLRKQAASRATMMVLCAVAVFGLLGALSWAISREVAPATYIATSQLKATGRNRTLNPAELAEWQSFHVGLLEDPRFHETAADRFKKQDMVSLSSAPQVANLIRNGLTTESLSTGQLSLHLKGKGADSTTRTLETFTAALASHANAAQQQRLDGGVTEVSLAATPGLDPLDNTRTIYAGAILATGVTAAAFLWMFLWRRLAGAKTAFEQDAQIAGALDDARWNNFTSAQMAKTRS